ncbi:Hypothetical predicted protein [Cloeon dipterum]|uniref:Uncharacterized protein n=1 Tax=Cloeon dipterum TaxID=197152 RepID=A0A8S1DJR4_9INSE|nr:Hypothetical predicted protein [Cloeon dipterum]
MKVVVFASSLFLLLLAGGASSSPDYKLISSKQWPPHKVLGAEPLVAESTETKYVVRFVKNQKIENAIDVAVIKNEIKKRTLPDGNVRCGPFQVSYLGKCRDILSPKYKILVNTNSASNQ